MVVRLVCLAVTFISKEETNDLNEPMHAMLSFTEPCPPPRNSIWRTVRPAPYDKRTGGQGGRQRRYVQWSRLFKPASITFLSWPFADSSSGVESARGASRSSEPELEPWYV